MPRFIPLRKPFLIRPILVLWIVSWLSMQISNTCTMPELALDIASNGMPAGCTEMDPNSAQGPAHDSMPHPDCSFKPCLDSQPHPAFGIKLDQPHTPLVILGLIGLIGLLFPRILAISCIRYATIPPLRRRHLLIYRFCTLRN